MWATAAFWLFYVILPLGIVGYVMARWLWPHRRLEVAVAGTAGDARGEVVRLLSSLPQDIRAEIQDPRRAFLYLASRIDDACRYCAADAYICYYLHVLRLVNAMLRTED